MVVSALCLSTCFSQCTSGLLPLNSGRFVTVLYYLTLGTATANLIISIHTGMLCISRMSGFMLGRTSKHQETLQDLRVEAHRYFELLDESEISSGISETVLDIGLKKVRSKFSEMLFNQPIVVVPWNKLGNGRLITSFDEWFCYECGFLSWANIWCFKLGAVMLLANYGLYIHAFLTADSLLTLESNRIGYEIAKIVFLALIGYAIVIFVFFETWYNFLHPKPESKFATSRWHPRGQIKSGILNVPSSSCSKEHQFLRSLVSLETGYFHPYSRGPIPHSQEINAIFKYSETLFGHFSFESEEAVRVCDMVAILGVNIFSFNKKYNALSDSLVYTFCGKSTLQIDKGIANVHESLRKYPSLQQAALQLAVTFLEKMITNSSVDCDEQDVINDNPVAHVPDEVTQGLAQLSEILASRITLIQLKLPVPRSHDPNVEDPSVDVVGTLLQQKWRATRTTAALQMLDISRSVGKILLEDWKTEMKKVLSKLLF
jgi:hypothetical protein